MRFGWLKNDGLLFPVWITGERKAYQRKEVRICPAGGEGQQWVTAERITMLESVTLAPGDDAGFARELAARNGSVALMRDCSPIPPRAADAHTQALYDELKAGGVTPAEGPSTLRGIPS